VKKKRKKIKIALFSDAMPSKNFDGVSMTLYTVFNKLPKEQFDVILITAKEPVVKNSFKYPYYKIPHLNLPIYKDYPIALPQLNFKLKHKLKNFNPDIVHITTPFLSGPFALEYAKQNKIPVLTIYHTHFVSYLKYYLGNSNALYKFTNKLLIKHLKTFYNSTNQILVPTNIIKKELKSYGIKENLMEVWGRGIDTNNYSPKKVNKNLYFKITGNNKRNILFVSRLVWYKGLKYLVEINKKIIKQRNDVNFIVIGDGPQKPYLEKNMQNTFFLGKKSHYELPQYYSSADCFIFTSDTETFGNVVLEAMSCACPVIVTDSGGPSDYVEDGVSGFKVKVADTNDFCNKINIIFDNQIIKAYISQNAYNYAQTQSWDNLTKRLVRYYVNLVK
jgi:glycosyltransferase involved in cell wall biosynthesis